MTTPNLDATGHQWVGVLVRFNFQLEYQKGWDTMVADALSQVTTCLDPEAMQSILDGVTLGMAHRAESHNPSVVEGDHNVEKEVHVTVGQVQDEMHVTDWATAQKEDPVLNAMLNWLGAQKKTDLRTLLGEHASCKEGWVVWRNCQETHYSPECPLFTLYTQRGEWGSTTLCGPRGTSNCCSDWVSLRCRTPRLWPYSVLTTWTLFSGQEWPNRWDKLLGPAHTAFSMRVGFHKAPLCPIVAMAPWISCMLTSQALRPHWSKTQSPKVANILVFQDHFTKHVLAYMTPDQTAKSIAKFLYGGYISIFGAPARLLSDRGANFTSSVIEENVQDPWHKTTVDHPLPPRD